MIVFYVTATHNSLPADPESDAGKKMRVDIAKFFTLADAEKHMGRRHGTWRDLRIDEREETEDEQHPAHRAHRASIPFPE